MATLGWNKVKIRSRRSMWIILCVAGIICFSFIVYGVWKTVDSSCEQDTNLAELDAGNNRTVSISAQSCWEMTRALYYEVKDKGIVVSSKGMFDTDSGHADHKFSMVFAENKSLIGILDKLPDISGVGQLVAMYDFKSGKSWPHQRFDEVSTHEAAQQQWRTIFYRLERENPQLVMPSEF